MISLWRREDLCSKFEELTIVDPGSHPFMKTRCFVLRYCADTRDHSRNGGREFHLCNGEAACMNLNGGARG
jgi:hypothetical protein